jgi:adenine-specific DNA methylase
VNFIELETPQKLRGGYYTPPDIASFLTRWVLEARPRRILEPACGDGAFFRALAEQEPVGLETVIGCELDPAEAEKARQFAALPASSTTILADDFLRWALARLEHTPEFEAALGNPPFIRYQYLDAGQQRRAEQLFSRLGLPFTKHTNAWVPFVVASLALLRPGGRLAMVVPAELLHVLHAQGLRDFLLRQCCRVLVLDPEDLWFGDTLQCVVLLLAEKAPAGQESPGKLAIVPLTRDALQRNRAARFWRQAEFIDGQELNGKWMPTLLHPSERAILDELRQHPRVRRFGDIASVDVGIVTGANRFFLVPDETVKKYGLEKFAHPMFGRSDHVAGVIYDKSCQQANGRDGLPANFLWFDDVPISQLPAGARRYIRAGEAQGLHRRYKCRIRKPWYRVPSVYAAPVAMLKRCHHFPRLILNRAGAFTTDTAYRVVPRKIRAEDLVFTFINSLTSLCCELEGRHYGGGVLELVPSEIERLLVPVAAADRGRLDRLDRLLCQPLCAETVLQEQDDHVLSDLGLDRPDRTTLAQAWFRLRRRRQRKGILARLGRE